MNKNINKTVFYTYMEKAYFFRKEEKGVRCTACRHNCFIKEGMLGICGVKANINNELYSLVYAKPLAVAIDPIEKKPLFHFIPGSKALSIGTFGCNFRCLFCQNYDMSQGVKGKSLEETRRMIDNYSKQLEPEQVVDLAIMSNIEVIAYTYNEPLIWLEFVYDVARLAKKENIKNVLVTNGYVEKEPLKQLLPYIDAANVDVKAFKQETYIKVIKGKLEPVLNNIVLMNENNVHVETTYLIIPGLNDDPEEIRMFAKWQVKKLGPDAPIHFSRFFPHYKMTKTPPTPVESLIKARNIAMEEGVKYVYIGNVAGHEGENTYCPSCGKLLVRRVGFEIIEWNITENLECRFCGEKIAIKGDRWAGKSYLWF